MDMNSDSLFTRRGVLVGLGVSLASMATAQTGSTTSPPGTQPTTPPANIDALASITQNEWIHLKRQTDDDHQQVTTLAPIPGRLDKVEKDAVSLFDKTAALSGETAALKSAAQRDYAHRVQQTCQAFLVALDMNCMILEKILALQNALHLEITGGLRMDLANPTTYNSKFESEIRAIRGQAGSALELPPIFGNDPVIRFGVNLIGLFLPPRGSLKPEAKTKLDNLLFVLLTAKSFDDEGRQQMAEIDKLKGRLDAINQAAERAFVRHADLVGSSKRWGKDLEANEREGARQELVQKENEWANKFKPDAPLVGKEADGLTIANQCTEEVRVLTDQYRDTAKNYIAYLEDCKKALEDRKNKIVPDPGKAEIISKLTSKLGEAIKSMEVDITGAKKQFLI